MTVVFVTATGTEVGKTWWTAATTRALRTGSVSVSARKPAQSFDPADGTRTDAEELAAATGERIRAVRGEEFSFARPLAPPMAADALGMRPFLVADLVAAMEPSDAAITFVEGAGGLRSPMAHDGDNRDLARALAPDLILVVAEAGLGTINLVRLTVEALDPLDIAVVVALNRFDPDDAVHAANLGWLRDRDRLRVVTDPAELADHLVNPGARVGTPS